MARDKSKFDRRNKHFPGELLRHKKHGYIVKLIGKGREGWGRTIQLVQGQVPDTSFTFHHHDEPGAIGYVATCTLNQSFESLGPAAKILFTDQ